MLTVKYRIRRTPGCSELFSSEELISGVYVQVGVRSGWASAQRWLQETADEHGLTVYHRDAFVRVRADGTHEVMAVAV